ncbi:MAG: hypothetical protein ACTS3F_08380 [Phycisphaerales bacterium]
MTHPAPVPIHPALHPRRTHPRRAPLAALALIFIIALPGCGSEPPPDTARPAEPATPSDADPSTSAIARMIDAEMCKDPMAPDDAAGVALAIERIEMLSNDRTYRITFEPEHAVIPRNRYFAARIEITPADGTAPAAPIALRVSGAMPQHEHGLNARPIVDEPGPDAEPPPSPAASAFRVHGLLLHMPGRWELYFDITQSGITERAQCSIQLP